MEEIIKEIRKVVHHRLQSFRYLQQFEDDIVNDVYIKMHQATKGTFKFENGQHQFRYTHQAAWQVIDRYHNNNGYAAGNSITTKAFFIQKDNTIDDAASNNFFDENTINYFPMQDEMLDKEYEQKMVDQFLASLDARDAIFVKMLMEDINYTKMARRLAEMGIKTQKGTHFTREGVRLEVIKIKEKLKKNIEKIELFNIS